MPTTSKSAISRSLPGAAVALAVALTLCLALPARADDRSQAQNQFARAVRMRTMLNGYLVKDRPLSAYLQTVAAYHKVYLISFRADEATPALVAEAELYEEMGRLYDPKYFQSAIDACNFLVKQYPGSSYRGEALLSVARIQKDDLDAPSDAEGTYQDYLKRFPHSQKAKQVRGALKDIQDAELKERTLPPSRRPLQIQFLQTLRWKQRRRTFPPSRRLLQIPFPQMRKWKQRTRPIKTFVSSPPTSRPMRAVRTPIRA